MITTDLLAIRRIAKGAHGIQVWADNRPYVYHLDAVYQELHWAAYKETVVNQNKEQLYLAAYFHDVLEDTEWSPERVATVIGGEATSLVIAVTNEPGKNRKERHAKTYPKIRQFGTTAVALKLADRLANTLVCIRTGAKQLKMYKDEYKDFKKALYLEGELKSMWTELDKVSL